MCITRRVIQRLKNLRFGGSTLGSRKKGEGTHILVRVLRGGARKAIEPSAKRNPRNRCRVWASQARARCARGRLHVRRRRYPQVRRDSSYAERSRQSY